MNKYYPNILSTGQCIAIRDSMLSYLQENKLAVEKSETSKGTFSFFNLKETLNYLLEIEKIIFNDYGNKLSFKNTYTRIYKKSHELKIHTDKPGLDVTLSVCVHSTIDQDWPIHVSKSIVNRVWCNTLPIDEYKKSFDSYVTPVGSGVACLGTKSPHWRDPLVCTDDQMVIQTFFHWEQNYE